MSRLLRLLLPLRCLGCGAHVPEDDGPAEPLCIGCALRLAPPPAPRCPRCDLPRGTGPGRPAECGGCGDWPARLVGARSAVALRPPADALVQALKYGGWRAAAGPMARRMAHRLRDSGVSRADALVPVPTTGSRRRRRGYNQAEVLARELAAYLDLPVLDALARSGASVSQVALPVDRRRANVEGAFEPGPAARRAHALSHTLLVDDVLTTGATAGAAAEALGDLGVGRVTAVTFARALPQPVVLAGPDTPTFQF